MSDQTNAVTLDGRVTALEIKTAVLESDMKNVKEDITSIKDDTRWIRRAVTGALITLAVTTVGGIIVWLAKMAFN
jgi:hypothetical protein